MYVNNEAPEHSIICVRKKDFVIVLAPSDYNRSSVLSDRLLFILHVSKNNSLSIVSSLTGSHMYH